MFVASRLRRSSAFFSPDAGYARSASMASTDRALGRAFLPRATTSRSEPCRQTNGHNDYSSLSERLLGSRMNWH